MQPRAAAGLSAECSKGLFLSARPDKDDERAAREREKRRVRQEER